MATASPEHERLLDLVAAYCLDHGVADLTLRGVARAVGSNNRMLLYYFGSKEAMISAALQQAAQRFPQLLNAFELLEQPSRTLPERLDDTWKAISADVNLPFIRLFFEVFGLAAHQPGRFDAYLGSVGHEWSARVAAIFQREGATPAAARRIGTEIVALWRGLQMDLLSSGERKRIDRTHREAMNRLVHSS